MDADTLKYIGIGLMVIGMAATAIGIGNIFSSALNAIARNPSAEGKMSKYIYIGAALTEAMGLFSFVLAMLIFFS